jgi:hypothetical protein
MQAEFSKKDYFLKECKKLLTAVPGPCYIGAALKRFSTRLAFNNKDNKRYPQETGDAWAQAGRAAHEQGMRKRMQKGGGFYYESS